MFFFSRECDKPNGVYIPYHSNSSREEVKVQLYLMPHAQNPSQLEEKSRVLLRLLLCLAEVSILDVGVELGFLCGG